MGNPFSYFHAAQIRIARPTGQLNEIIRFYEEGLGLKRIGEFSQHNGYDGVMFGLPHADYHLEFTQYEGKALLPFPIPTVSSFLCAECRQTDSDHFKAKTHGLSRG